MRHSLVGGVVVAALLAAGSAGASAQETGTPIFMGPYRTFQQHQVAVAFSDPGSGVSYALEGSYHYGHGVNDFGFRGGFEDLNGGGGTRVLLGGDFRTRILSYSDNIPVDGALTVGFGANVGSGPDVFYLPVGISVGRRILLQNSNVTFTPFAQPVLVPVFGSGNSDVKFALGLGVDMRFSQDWAVKVTGGIGDIDGVGIALAYIH